MSVALDPPCDQDARKRLAGSELQVRIGLVVTQQDVVFRGSLLDQVVLEGERLDHRVGDDHLEARGLFQQRVEPRAHAAGADRKSTRLNSSHLVISYAVFCLKKKNLTIHLIYVTHLI